MMHSMVEAALVSINEEVAKSYRDYRNYKQSFVHMMDDVYTKSQSIRYIGDKENANTDSALVATKRSLIFNELNKNLYRKFFMNREELQACKQGYISIADASRNINLSHTQINRYIDSKKIWKGRYRISSDNTKCVEDSKMVWIMHSLAALH